MMHFPIRNLIPALARLVFGAALLAPLAVSAAGMAMPEQQMGGAISAASMDKPAADECCDGVKYVAPPCEHASLCAAKADGMRHASATGQGTYTGLSRSYRTATTDVSRQPFIKSIRLIAAGPPLSILFCSFQI
jgi:hypothetical protein